MTNRSIREVCEKVGAAYGIGTDEICGGCTTPEGGRARNTAIYIARQTTYHPLFVIAKHFKGESVKTVIGICSEIQLAIQEDGALKEEIERILAKPRTARETINTSVPLRTKNRVRRRNIAIKPIRKAPEASAQNAVAFSPNAPESSLENDQRSAMSVPAEARWWFLWCRKNASGYENAVNAKKFLALVEEAREDIGYDPKLRIGERARDRGLQQSLDERDRIMSSFNALVEQELARLNFVTQNSGGLDSVSVSC